MTDATLVRALLLALAVALAALASARSVAPRRTRGRLRDLAEVGGARENQLVGYGIVTGLPGPGDDAPSRSPSSPCSRCCGGSGVQVDPAQLRLRNVAAVIVTATLPPFARPGAEDRRHRLVGRQRAVARRAASSSRPS